jgi:hypothetical protein
MLRRSAGPAAVPRLSTQRSIRLSLLSPERCNAAHRTVNTKPQSHTEPTEAR